VSPPTWGEIDVRRFLTVATVGSLLVTGAALLPGVAQAAGDRPDTLAQARQASPSATGSWLRETLGSAGDRDWFRFSLAQDQRVLVTLGRLPANYSLAVYDSSGDKVASSDRRGRKFEQLYLPLSAGDSFVRVAASGDSVDPDAAYRLQFRPLPTAVVFAEQKGRLSGQGFEVRGELLNNTGHRVTVQRLRVVFRDADGNKVGSTDEGIRPGPVAARHRVEFEIERTAVQVPADAASYRLTVNAAATDDPLQRGVRMNPDPVDQVSPGLRVYSGTVKNTTDHTITNVYPTVIEYDSRGRANAIGYGLVKMLAPGQSKPYSFSVDSSDLPKPNATRQYPTILNDLTG
jgi:hypothetical protein